MDHQTPINSNGAHERPAREVAGNAADLWHQIFILGELQLRLLAVEFGAGIRQARVACIVLAGGCLVALASLPVTLACLALVLAETTALSLAGAFAVVWVLAASISCALITVGWLQLRKNTIALPRSRDEWRSNWSWLKETSRRERSAPTRQPANGRF